MLLALSNSALCRTLCEYLQLHFGARVHSNKNRLKKMLHLKLTTRAEQISVESLEMSISPLEHAYPQVG